MIPRTALCACRHVPLSLRRNLATSSTSPSSSPKPSAAAATAASTTPESSCPEGTVMKGLNFLKAGSDPIAQPNSSYPEWLWELASPLSSSSVITSTTVNKGAKVVNKSKGKGRDAGTEKREFRRENRNNIKASNTLKG